MPGARTPGRPAAFHRAAGAHLLDGRGVASVTRADRVTTSGRSVRVQLLSLLLWCIVSALAGVLLGYGIHRLFLAPRHQAPWATPVALSVNRSLLETPAAGSTLPSARPVDVTLHLATRTEPRHVEPEPRASALGIPIARVVIPAIGVNAPVVVKSIDPNGVMQSPDTPSDVAWYDFTALPAAGSNVVLAGHVDFADVGPAVFWNLWRLATGDLIQLHLVDGSVAVYRVVWSQTVSETTTAVDQIIGPTPGEVVTLITCTGNYNPVTGRYDQRLVVRAERVGLDGPPGLE